MKINQEMCSVNCPCKANIAKRSDWENLNLVQNKRCRGWDFSGSYETYDQCLTATAARATHTTPF